MRATPVSGIEPSDLVSIRLRGDTGDEVRRLAESRRLGRGGAVQPLALSVRSAVVPEYSIRVETAVAPEYSIRLSFLV